LFDLHPPLPSWREVAVRERKTKTDWAIEMARLLEGRYAHCAKVILVCDNLNTHTKGAFYEAFEPERARTLLASRYGSPGHSACGDPRLTKARHWQTAARTDPSPIAV